MADRNILLIAYYFPPLGMGGVGRPLALFKNLPEHGYNVHVITVKNIVYPEYDYTLLDDTDTDRIHRTGSLDPSRLLYIAGKRKQMQSFGSSRGKRLILKPDMKRGWVPFAFKKAKTLINGITFDAVITTSPPPSAHLVGMKIKEKYNIPWIADFRDFWFSRPIEEVYGSQRKVNYAIDLKDKIVQKADNIVCTSEAIRDYVGRGEVIYNAADPGTIDLWGKSDNKTDKFTIGILGTVNDLCPVLPLFKALAEADKSISTILDMLSIVHVGNCDKEYILEQAAHFKLEGNIEFCGYLPRQEAVSRLSGANLLYIGIRNYGKKHILPGRIFDYFVSGKPIQGVVPRNSDAEKLLDAYPFGASFNSSEIKEIAEYLIKIIGGHLRLSDKQTDISKYTHDKLVADYVRIISNVIENPK